MRTRTALFLCLMSAAGMLLISLLGALTGPAFGVWLGAAGSLAFFALPAYLGLCEIDGNQQALLMRRKLSSAQALWLAACGALLVCPSLMLSLVVQSVLSTMGLTLAAAQGSVNASLFLPMLLASGVLAPVCEELFFRGYLLGALGRMGRGRAAAATAILFAAVHGPGLETPGYLLIGLLLALLAYRTDSVLAPVLAHMAYNTALLLLAFCGAGALFARLHPLSGALLLAGCAGFVYALKRLWLSRGTREAMDLESVRLTKRQLLGAAAICALVLAAQIITGVTAR